MRQKKRTSGIFQAGGEGEARAELTSRDSELDSGLNRPCKAAPLPWGLLTPGGTSEWGFWALWDLLSMEPTSQACDITGPAKTRNPDSIPWPQTGRSSLPALALARDDKDGQARAYG